VEKARFKKKKKSKNMGRKKGQPFAAGRTKPGRPQSIIFAEKRESWVQGITNDQPRPVQVRGRKKKIEMSPGRAKA